MKSTEKLYGVSPLHFAYFHSYIGIIQEKIRLAKIRLNYLVNMLEDTNNYEKYAEINENITSINKAIKFNEALEQEYKEAIMQRKLNEKRDKKNK